MDEPTANQFITSLVKSVQALCNGYIDFSSTVEVVGHIHLNIDRKVKLDYVLTEEVSKAVGEDATLFSSHSYHSKPPGGLISEDLTEKPESALTPKSSSTNSSRRKSHHVPRVDDSESFSFTSVSQVTSHTHTINNTSAAVETKEKIDTSYSDNSDISHESTSVLNTEKESWRTVSNNVPSSQDRRRKSSCGLITSAAKHRRTSQEDLMSEQPDPLLVQIKEEPEDDLPVYQGSVVETSAEDLAAPDFSSVVMESLDHVGQNEVTSFMTGTHGHHMQLKPYPVLLHATPELNLTAVSQPVPGLSSNTPPVPSTSTGQDFFSQSIDSPEKALCNYLGSNDSGNGSDNNPHCKSTASKYPMLRRQMGKKPVMGLLNCVNCDNVPGILGGRRGRPSCPDNSLRLQNSTEHFLEKIPFRLGAKKHSVSRACVVCEPAERKRNEQAGRRRKRNGRESTYRCRKCMKTLCVTPCFELYHSYADYEKEYFERKPNQNRNLDKE